MKLRRKIRTIFIPNLASSFGLSVIIPLIRAGRLLGCMMAVVWMAYNPNPFLVLDAILHHNNHLLREEDLSSCSSSESPFLLYSFYTCRLNPHLVMLLNNLVYLPSFFFFRPPPCSPSSEVTLLDGNFRFRLCISFVFWVCLQLGADKSLFESSEDL